MRSSNYTNKTDVPGGVVFFNSLYMRPVLIADGCSKLIDSLIQREDLDQGSVSKEALDILINNKIVTTVDQDSSASEKLKCFIKPPQISAACFIISERCNMRCRYCLADQSFCGNGRGEVMSKDIALRGLDFFVKAYSRTGFDVVPSITLYGGEPLIAFDTVRVLVERIRKYVLEGKLPKSTSVTINTNGTLLTDEIAATLRDNDVFISISLDGGPLCNSLRIYPDLKETYGDTIGAIDICKRVGCPYGISTTITDAVISNGREYLGQMESILPSRVGLNPLLSEESLKDGYPERLSGFVLDTVPKLMELGIVEDRTSEKMYALSNHIVRTHDCYAARGCQITITPSGRVGTCHGMLDIDEFYVSTVDDEFDPESDPVLNMWTTRSPLLMEECQRCSALGICGGGCPMNAFRSKGDLFGLDDSCCVLSRSLVDWYIVDNVDSFVRIDMDFPSDYHEPL